MKNRVFDVRQFWVGCILLSTAISGSAVTLGRHSGAGVIGRPLDIRVQALLGPDEDVGTLCINADVFYGDSQVSAGAVRTTVQRTSPDAAPSVRVQSSVAVDEPIVTVYVRAGCSMPFTRKYVLLADPITEPAKQAAGEAQAPAVEARASSVAALPTAPSATGSVAAPAANTGAGAVRGGVQRNADVLARARRAAAAPAGRQSPDSPKPEPVRVPKASKPSTPSVVRVPAAPEPDNTPRLVLDPLDVSLAIERDPVLKLSLSLLSEPTTSEETRAAAGLLWKSINASPEERLRDAQKLEVLEAESKGLREAEVKDKAAIEALSADLEKARYLNWLVYLLGALLLLALIAMALLWRRQQQNRKFEAAKAWWASEDAHSLEKEHADARVAPRGRLDLDLELNDESGLSSLEPHSSSVDLHESRAPVAAVKPGRVDIAPVSLASRAVATEELFDVQQQADFFVSLGENEQAIQVLRSHINESQTPSALSYLDLFKIFHKLGRQADYEKLREEFNQVFNAGAPPFEQYSDESQGLEAYETAFGRIQALWPEPRVLDVIEQSIFREADDAETEVFDLEAYRELLLLHAVAKEMIKRDEVESQSPKDFQNTKVQPLKAKGKVSSAVEERSADAGNLTQPMAYIPPASSSLGLDVDLDALSEISAFEASLPEVEKAVEPSSKPSRRESDQKPAGKDNLIDFEVLDFMTPDDPEDKPANKN
jgi:hypothetical protein